MVEKSSRLSHGGDLNLFAEILINAKQAEKREKLPGAKY